MSEFCELYIADADKDKRLCSVAMLFYLIISETQSNNFYETGLFLVNDTHNFT